MAQTSSNTRVVSLGFAAMAQHGITLLIVGTIVPNLMSTFNIRESMTGVLLGLGSLGFMAGSFFAGTVVDRTTVKTALIIGFVIEIFMLVMFGTAPVFFVAVAANFLLHFGCSFIETSSNVIPSLTRSKRSAHSVMNLVHMFFSIGAFVGPFLIGLYVGATGEWRPIMFLAMIPTAVLLVWVLTVRFPARQAAGTHSTNPFRNIRETLKERYAVLGSLTLFFYVGAEVGISSWIVYYLQQQLHLSPVYSATGLSILWIFIMVGRYLNSVLGNRFSSFALVFVSSIGGAIGVIFFLLAKTMIPAYILLAWIGLCLAGVFPNVMAELNNKNPDKIGTVTSVMAMGASLGGGLFQWIVGFVAEHVSLTAAFVVPLVLQLLVIVSFAAAVGTVRWRHDPEGASAPQ